MGKIIREETPSEKNFVKHLREARRHLNMAARTLVASVPGRYGWTSDILESPTKEWLLDLIADAYSKTHEAQGLGNVSKESYFAVYMFMDE